MSFLQATFEKWRAQKREESGSRLAWYIAAEIVDRFYVSHGIRASSIQHEGLGYYGIQFSKVGCPVRHGKSKNLGRMTIQGNVENWISGSPGDHGLKLTSRLLAGEPTEPMIPDAIRHLQLPPFPSTPHTHCHHKRRGESFQLLFRVAALLAMEDRLHIDNGELAFYRGKSLDNLSQTPEHPGYFLFGKLVVRGDGFVLNPGKNCSLWELWMQGFSEKYIMDWVYDHQE